MNGVARMMVGVGRCGRVLSEGLLDRRYLENRVCSSHCVKSWGDFPFLSSPYRSYKYKRPTIFVYAIHFTCNFDKAGQSLADFFSFFFAILIPFQFLCEEVSTSPLPCPNASFKTTTCGA